MWTRRRVAWLRWYERIPPEVRDVVWRFPERHWHLLSMIARCGPPAMDLAGSNPALAYALASNWIFRRPPVTRPMRAARALAGKKQVRILDWLGFPGTEGTRKILARIPHESISIFLLLLLRRRARDTRLMKRLAHLPRVNLGALRLVADRELEPCVTAALLMESCEREDDGRNDITRLELRRMTSLFRQLFPLESRLPRIRTLTDLKDWNESLQADMARLRPQYACADGPGPAPFPPPPLPGTDVIVPITSADELIREGNARRNCIALYAESIKGGRAYVYRVLTPQRCTLLLEHAKKGWHIGDLQQSCNRPASSDAWAAVETWLAQSIHCARRSMVTR